MKLILASLVALFSLNSMAQMSPEVSAAIGESMQRAASAHQKSADYQKITKTVESLYDVKCNNGGTTFFFPILLNTVTHKTTCKGEKQKIKLTITSKMKTDKEDNLVFKVKSYKVKFKK